MSNLNTEDIAEYNEKYDMLFEVKKVQIEDYGNDGEIEEIRTWYAATNRLIPEQCYPCKDKETAEELCKFLNTVPELGSPAMDNLSEWSSLITELSNKEIRLYELKDEYRIKSEELLQDAKKLKEETKQDIIKDRYGGNNDKTRKQYVKDSLIDESKVIDDLEFSIEYIKRRISFLKQLIHTKTVMLEVKQ